MQAQKKYIARAEARAQEYGPKIYQYHKATNRCQERYDKYSERERKARCIERLHARYKTQIDKAGLGYIPPDYWLIVEEISGAENAANTVLAGVLTGGVYTALQVLSFATGGDGGIKDKRYKYTDDPNHYQHRILAHPNFQKQFEKETGYPMNITELSEFRRHDSTQVRLRQTLQNKGLILPAKWHIDHRQQFARAVANKVKHDADERWQAAMQQKGLDLPINLEWESFQLHPSIQQKIAQQMGDMYVKNVRADWNKANFKRYVLDVNIERRTQRYLNMLNNARVHFEQGGKYAEAGKQALRSVVIPPISMSLSLFLICLTLIKLPLKAVEVIKPSWSTYLPRWATFATKVAPVLLLIVLPVLLVKSQFTHHQQSPVNYFLGKVEQASNPMFSFALRWTLHVQPILHPLGLKLEQHSGIYRSLEPLTHFMAQFDTQLNAYTSEDNPHQQVNKVFNNQATLNISSNVSGATIRIMNIKPKYHHNIRLKPGNYDIQVSADGYQTYRRWHRVLAGKQSINIELKKR